MKEREREELIMLKLKRFVVNYVNPNFSGVGTRDYRHAKLADAAAWEGCFPEWDH